MLLVGVDDEQHTRQVSHLLDTTQRSLELGDLTLLGNLLLLVQDVEAPLFAVSLELVETVNRCLDGLVVGQHAAEPAVSNPVLVGRASSLGDDIRCLALGTYEQDLLALGDGMADKLAGLAQLDGRLLQVDDVDAVLLAEDVRLHLRVPPLGLVTEVDAGVE